MLRFLITPRWIGLALFAGVLAGVSIHLGHWQFDRREQRQDNNARVEAHLDQEPVALNSLSSPGSDLDRELEWTPVRVSGTYASDLEVTLKYQTRSRQAGVEVVTPLILDDGSAVLINRGWMPSANTTQQPDNIPPPTAGPVTVTGWLRVNSTADGQAIRVAEGQVRAISSEGLAEWVSKPIYPGFIDLREQNPVAGAGLELRPDPDLGGGPHFFYALQWYFFAGLAIFGYFYFAWSEAQLRRKELGQGHQA